MSSVDSRLRRAFEAGVSEARQVSEQAARVALTGLGVGAEMPTGLSVGDQNLRRALRTRARQLGNDNLLAGLPLLVEEIAYEQWHRILFTRFLAENRLLMYSSNVPISLEECAALAAEEGESDAFQVGARFATAMLPGIFRVEDPSSAVHFSAEGRIALRGILGRLPASVFTAEDSLGWAYQFWQSKKKEQVDASQRKVGGADIAPVTQLFTEHYMVQFLLENSLGAWWVARHPQSHLVQEFQFLRRRDDHSVAAGSFPNWPDRAAEVTMMDPCCGSGHFLVAAFELLRRMRMEEEGLGSTEAGDSVLKENLFGLEIDPRCVQITTFALALSAWKSGGYRPLPIPNIACSGVSVAGQAESWLTLAGTDTNLRATLQRLHELFKDAPNYGSLIDPRNVESDEGLFGSDIADVLPILERALSAERGHVDAAAAVLGIAAEGASRAGRFLAQTYTLVATNVPYLTRNKQADALRDFSERYHPDAKGDLSTVFVERCFAFAGTHGTCALVTPQNWFSLGAYEKLRRAILTNRRWDFLALLGPRAFQKMNWWAARTILLVVSGERPPRHHLLPGVDVSGSRVPAEKALLLQTTPILQTTQTEQLRHPDARVALEVIEEALLLSKYADSYQGMKTGDDERFRRYFWEVPAVKGPWRFYQGSVGESTPYGGLECILDWRDEGKSFARSQGHGAWTRPGVAVSQMRALPVTLYLGGPFDSNMAAVIPRDPTHLAAIWAFCNSDGYHAAVRRLDSKTGVTNATLVKVPFELESWQREVAIQSESLPPPCSDSPTQWLFNGQPTGTTHPLQVAVARLVGYHWPEQSESDLESHGDEDGVVPLAALAGKPPASERLRLLLDDAFKGWTESDESASLAAVGHRGRSLETWLRDDFFQQHCRLFRQRPFVWHVWDRHPDGFAALVHYHRLDMAMLDKLIYGYLGEWIARQEAAQDLGDPGAEGRLGAAQWLRRQLLAIRDGEVTSDGTSGYDIYIRWKPLAHQPLGWRPDIDDGVRMNIRPFVHAQVLRVVPKIDWEPDRGKESDGSLRRNDLHFSQSQRRQARELGEVHPR